MKHRTKVLSGLIPLAIVDALIPVPIIGLILMYVIFANPPWFLNLVDRIYGRAEGGELTGIDQRQARAEAQTPQTR